MSSRSTSSSPLAVKSAAACNPPVRTNTACVSRKIGGNWQIISGSNIEDAFGERKPRRRSCAMEALPHTPQADPAENLRAAPFDARRTLGSSVTRTRFFSASFSPGIRSATRSSRFEMMPSLKRKPATSSSSSPGVRRVTPSEYCPARISRGSSPAR